MEAKRITATEQQKLVTSCLHSVAEVSEKLGLSESTIRRTIRNLGVKKVHGPTVAGFVLFSTYPVDVTIPYYE